MPSPVGHALGGLIAGGLADHLVGRRPGEGSGPRRAPVPSPGPTSRPAPGPSWVALAALAMSPDLDLLFGTHSTYSHSVGAVALVATLAGLLTWGRAAPSRGHAALAAAIIAAATYGSHLLLDWLGTDTSPPYGIMLWWPFSSDFSKAPVSWFPSVSREVLSREFWVGNTIAVTFELLTLGPLFWLTTRARASRRQVGR